MRVLVKAVYIKGNCVKYTVNSDVLFWHACGV